MINQQLKEEIQKLEDGVFEEGALHGVALDLVQQIINLPGEEFTDEECMWMVHQLTNAWSKLDDQGLI